MEHNEFKDQLYEVLDENDVALGIDFYNKNKGRKCF